MQDSIDNYITINKFKDGRCKILIDNKCHQGSIYKKLSEMGYICEGKNKFRLLKHRTIDEFFTLSQLVDEFTKYLETLDISKYEGKLTFDEISNYFQNKKPIKYNELMKAYMPK